MQLVCCVGNTAGDLSLLRLIFFISYIWINFIKCIFGKCVNTLHSLQVYRKPCMCDVSAHRFSLALRVGRVLIPNPSVQDVWFGMRPIRFGAPCDQNNYCQNSLFMSNIKILLAHVEPKLKRAHLNQKVLAVHQLLSINCSMLVGLSWLARLVKLNVKRFVPTLFN